MLTVEMNARRIGRRPCDVEGCDRPSHGGGKCLMHYKRLRRNGRTERIVAKREVRNVVGGTLCWLDVGRGRFAVVDREDYDRVAHIKWHVSPNGYVHGYDSHTGANVLLHRLIMRTPRGWDADHCRGDRLDNRKCMLRNCRHMQNQANRSPNRTKRYKGMSWDKANRKWRATIVHDGKRYELGLFVFPLQAAIAYNVKSILLNGEFARLNVL